jgi:hypothetical protein
MKADRSVVLGSARGSRAVFAGSPKQFLGKTERKESARMKKSSGGRAALASTLAACAPQIPAKR